MHRAFWEWEAAKMTATAIILSDESSGPRHYEFTATIKFAFLALEVLPVINFADT